MQAGRIKKSLFILLCLSLTTVAIAQSKTPSVLERVQNVDDPELGELIRVTLEKQAEHRRPSQKETLELIRRVTLSYTQIKLLDQQIQEVGRKIQANTGTPEMRYELLLAKTELEAKLMEKLADLRELMGVTPRYAFSKQPVDTLNTWLRLNPIDDDRVYVLDTVKPFIDYWATTRFKPLGLMSQGDVMDLIRERLRDPNNLPIRTDILWRNKAGEELRDRVIGVTREMGAAMQAEVRMGRNDFIGSGEAPFLLRQGRIITFYPLPVRRQDDSSNSSLVTGTVKPHDIESHILWRITFQWNVPLTFRIEYDRASFDLAQHIAEEIRTIAKRLGISELVGVDSILVEPLPETAFLGHWRAISKGDIREITLQPSGQSELTLNRQPDGSKGDPEMSAPWYLTTKEIIIDLNKVYAMGHRYVYRGHINSEGNLILDKGLIQCQGSFGLSGVTPIVLEKVKE